ncbi:MAG: hypothetical protein KGL39_06505 [Patescibacteria group bacterium]|nr:hypothetical protein [Patescibacteria group bacterium]
MPIQKLYHIQAWGHPVKPDLDYESDVNDFELLSKHYPMISIAMQRVIRYNDLVKAMEESGSWHQQP